MGDQFTPLLSKDASSLLRTLLYPLQPGPHLIEKMQDLECANALEAPLCGAQNNTEQNIETF